MTNLPLIIRLIITFTVLCSQCRLRCTFYVGNLYCKMVFPNALLLEKKTSVRVIFVEKDQKAMIEKKCIIVILYKAGLLYVFSNREISVKIKLIFIYLYLRLKLHGELS